MAIPGHPPVEERYPIPVNDDRPVHPPSAEPGSPPRAVAEASRWPAPGERLSATCWLNVRLHWPPAGWDGYRRALGVPRAGAASASRAVAAVGASAVLLAGCGFSVASPASAPALGLSVGAPPANHVHAVGVEPVDGTILVATHEGLFEFDQRGQPRRVSPVIDLEGFTVVGPGRYAASGHPGAGVDLPDPLGLIESTDAGRTWEPLSRSGQFDFHALTVGSAGFIGFDGALLHSADGQDWTTLDIPETPATLSASPDRPEVLATTAQGLLRSTDAGSSWAAIPEAPSLQVLDWLGDGLAVIGVDAAGDVWRSDDGGLSWERGPNLGSSPRAVSAGTWGLGGQRIVVATTAAVLASDDGGRSFEVVLQA